MNSSDLEFELLKTNKKKILFFVGIVCVVVILVASVLNLIRAKYRTTQSMPLYNATVNYTPYDFKMVAMYQENESGEYESIDTVPSSGYSLNMEESYCEVGDAIDNSVSMSYEDGKVYIGVVNKGTKCYLYFDEYELTLKSELLTFYSDVETRTSFSSTVTNTTTGTIYKSADESQYDNDGEVYYFAGAPTDNWVYFAGFYWRIIRINGDGSVRLIYSGNGAAATEGTVTQIGTSTFSIDSNTYNNNAYVGYMYTLNEVHGTGTDSGIKGVLDNWYETNIQNAGYADYIDANAGFCGDRTPSTSSSSSNGSGGTGTTLTYYGGYIRYNNSGTPTFGCSNDSDLYTVSSSNKGNKALTYPIGLITMDEVWYAGGYKAYNSIYYLCTNQYFLTMSSSDFLSSGVARVFIVMSHGGLDSGYVRAEFGVRPVINLRPDLEITGSGTITDPFQVVGA